MSSRNRMPQVPTIPTIAEQGVPGFESGTWQGLVAPASMPPEVLARLSKDLAGIMNIPALKAKLAEQGADVVTMTPAEMDKWLAAERQRWAVVVQKADIRLD